MTFDWVTFGFQLVNVLVLLAILRHFLFRPVAGVIARRQAETDATLKAAADARAGAEAATARAKAEAEATAAARHEVLVKAQAEAEAQRAAILQKAGSRRLKESLGVDVKVSSSQPTDRAAQPKVTLSKQWTPKLGASASSTLAANPANDVKVEYKMNKNISVIGSWEGKETDLKEDDTTESVFGLDLEYRVQFK